MRIHGTAKSSYLAHKRSLTNNPLIEYRWFLEQEVDSWGHWVALPLRRRLWLWRHGFTSPLGKLYDFDAYGYEAYLSERQRYRLFRDLNGHHRYLLDDKLSQYWMLADFPKHRPTAFGLVDDGFVHGVAGTVYDGDPTPVSAWLPPRLRRHSRLVLKQLRGLGGKEVRVCEHDDGFLLDEEPVTEAELCDDLSALSSYLVTEFVDQHPYASELYPHASNTIRLLTLWDAEAEEMLTPIAVHRIGTERSRPIDNVSAGGLTAEIDLVSGTLGRAAQKPFTGEVPWYTTHPDTGTRIEGVRVSHWDAVRSTVERIARENTNIPLIGWDVILTPSGVPVVIEANTGTDIDLLQVHRPLLADEAVASVVSRHLEDVDADVPSR